jgi:hypothetical protein
MSNEKFQRFSDRIFKCTPLLTRAGWYAKLREGKCIGPFFSKEAAQLALFELFAIPPEASEHLISETAEAPPRYSPDSRKS